MSNSHELTQHQLLLNINIVKEYLKCTRAHTAPLEMIPAIVGAAVATGDVTSPEVVIWAVFGLLYHLAGYGMNSYTDWANGYDMMDENKAHHPLNTGTIKPTTAKKLVMGLLGITLIYTAVFAYPSYAAIGMVLGATVLGSVYNEYGKKFQEKWIPISVAHSMTFAVPYVASSVDPNPYILGLGTAFVFLWVVFQIAVSGEVKDIMQDEENYLSKLGTQTMAGGVYFSSQTHIFSIVVKTASFVVALLMTIVLGRTGVSAALVLLFASAGYFMMGKLLKSGTYHRNNRIQQMSFIEMCMVYIMLSSVIGSIGIVPATVLMIGATAWVMVFNQIEWGTTLAPDV